MPRTNVPQKLKLVDDMTFEQLQYVRGWNAAVFMMGNTAGEYRYPQVGGAEEYKRGWNAAYALMGIYPEPIYARKPRGL